MRRENLPLLAAAAALASWAVSVTADSVAWTYQGCYIDSIANRALKEDFLYSNDMTIADCLDYCGEGGYTLAGLEYSIQCYCDLALSAASGPTDPASCSMNCSGNSNETCGGPNRLSLYMSDAMKPAVNPGINGYTSTGCYVDMVSTRTLSQWVAIPGGTDEMTVAACTEACLAGGFSKAGVEYGGECWCDNVLHGSVSSSSCSMPCKGNVSELCGGPNAINVYTLPSAALASAPGSTSPSILVGVPVAATTSAAFSALASNVQSAAPTTSSSLAVSTSLSSATPSSPTMMTAMGMYQSELISNGNFADASAWTESTNPQISNTDALSGQYITNGYLDAYAITSTSYRTPGYRSLCISQPISIPRTGAWNLTAQIGRSIPNDKNGVSTDRLSYYVYVDTTPVVYGDVCNPSVRPCTSIGAFGSYNNITAIINAATSTLGAHNFSVCGVFTTSTQTSSSLWDTFLIDSVSLWGPGHRG